MASEKCLTNKVVLLTGATRGIGEAIANLFTKEGAKLAINSRTKAKLDVLAERLSEHGYKPFSIAGNMANEADARRVFNEAVDQFGRIDIVIHCAGISRQLTTIENMDMEDYDALMDVNARGTYLCCREAARVMLKQDKENLFRGRIVTFSSYMGVVGSPTVSAYSASKHAVMGISRSIAKELQPKGICVTTVCPREVDTPQRREVVPPDSDDSRWMATSEIAKQTLFLVTRPFWAGIQELIIGLPQNL